MKFLFCFYYQIVKKILGAYNSHNCKYFCGLIVFMRSLLIFVLLFSSTPLFAQLLPKPVQLPNGWRLSPAGQGFQLGDLPLNMAVSKTNKYVAVTNNGQSVQSIQLIDTKSAKVLSTVVIPKSWYGLQFSNDEQFLYASGGHDNRIMKYKVSGGKLQLADSIILGKP